MSYPHVYYTVSVVEQSSDDTLLSTEAVVSGESNIFPTSEMDFNLYDELTPKTS